MNSAIPVELIANQLLPQFIPKDVNATELTFQFTMAPNNTYQVSFIKKTTGSKSTWEFSGHKELLP